ncbi:hypothetical protein GCM10009733_091970 [Nonomuraea maheshkhaliensis]|uniref:Peptidase S33 tripeptidyl aminopeptidase-like C-terminal domain-containing protein n=1 Tax=Nonomuraea maheshkhaliensis TaxID=419590 RepID=A0ABN2H2D5_9ACTN
MAMNHAARHPGHPAEPILQSTVARWDLDRIVEGFRAEAGEEAGEEAATAAKAFLTEGTPETFAAFGQLCAPACSPDPNFPAESDIQAMSRMVPNPGLTMSFMSTARFDLTARLSLVQCPALVLAGARDPITPLSTAREIVDGLPGRPPGGVRTLGPPHPGHRERPVLPAAALLHHRLTSPEQRRHVGGGQGDRTGMARPGHEPALNATAYIVEIGIPGDHDDHPPASSRPPGPRPCPRRRHLRLQRAGR